MLVDLVGRIIILAGSGLIRLVRNHPAPMLLILAGGLYVASRSGWLDSTRIRSTAPRLAQEAAPLMDAFLQAAEGHTTARAQLKVVEPYGNVTVAEAAARYLARYRRSLNPSELRDALSSSGFRTSAAQLRRTMNAHPAFLRLSGDYVRDRKAFQLNGAHSIRFVRRRVRRAAIRWRSEASFHSCRSVGRIVRGRCRTRRTSSRLEMPGHPSRQRRRGWSGPRVVVLFRVDLCRRVYARFRGVRQELRQLRCVLRGFPVPAVLLRWRADQRRALQRVGQRTFDASRQGGQLQQGRTAYGLEPALS